MEEEKEVEVITDLSNSDVVTKYKTAADIVNKSLAGVISQCTNGKAVVEICKFGDGIIEGLCATAYKSKKMEKGIAFPTCVSVNECVGHYSPLLADESVVLKTGDVVKIDLGCHIDGFIAVAAHTIVVGADTVEGPVANILKAANTAAEVAQKMIKAGNKNSQVTEAIQEVAKTFGVNAVQGVLSHQMKQFVIDGNKVIIMRSDADQKVEEYQFETNEVYSVDIVFSTGEGKPKESEARTTVFKRAIDKTYRLKMDASRYVFNEVNKKYPTLPFTLRAFEDEKKARLGVVEMTKHEMLVPYPVIFEKSGDIVVQFKFTALILSSGTDRITGSGLYNAEKVSCATEPSDATKAILATSSKTKKKKNKKKKTAGEEADGKEEGDEADA